MTVVFALALTAWHLFLLRPAWTSIRNRMAPRPVDFALVSFVVYYDVGLILDGLGFPYNAPGFDELGSASPSAQVFVYIALAVVPPVLLLAARWGRPREMEWHGLSRRRLNASQERRLLTMFAVLALVAITISMAALAAGGNIPGARLTVSNWLGGGAILLYLPMHVAAYYAFSENARERRGIVISLILATAAALSVLALGQRTLVLLPFLIVAVCLIRFSFTKLVALMVVAFGIVIGLGLGFKPAGVSGSTAPSIIATVNENLARAPVAASAFELARPVGTSVMVYPGEGYVTVALIAVPRQLAPFKGETTAQRFTDVIQGDSRGSRWGFGLGMIEESIVNVGWLLGLLIIVGIGWGLGAVEGAVKRRSVLLLPIAGGALWLCGYHLFAIVLLYGGMAAVMFAVDVWFFGHDSARVARWQDSAGNRWTAIRTVLTPHRGDNS